MSSTLLIEHNDNGYIVSYNCTKLLQNNQLKPLRVDYLYDLAYRPLRINQETARRYFESDLLSRIAKHYQLQDGTACEMPPITNDAMYLVQVSSLPEDEPFEEYSDCYYVIPDDDEACQTFRGSVTAMVAGPSDKLELLDLVAMETVEMGLDNNGYENRPFRPTFIGTTILDSGGGSGATGRDNLAAPINSDEAAQTSAFLQGGNDRFTAVGILLVVGLCCAFLGLLLVVAVRWRRRKQHEDRLFLEQNHVIRATASGGRQEGGSQDNAAARDRRSSDFDENEGENYAEKEPSEEVQLSFDIADAMKNGMMNVHGDSHKIYAVDDLCSDSDVDSWAQTEATLGSLEVRLESITAEV